MSTYKISSYLHASNHKLEHETLKDFFQNSNNTHMITKNKDKMCKHIFRKTVNLSVLPGT